SGSRWSRPLPQIPVARTRRLPLLDRQPRVAPAGDDDAPRLVARAAEAAADVGDVAIAGCGEDLARVLRAAAGLAADDELRGARQVALDDGEEVRVRHRLAGGFIEEHDGHVARAGGMACLELRLGADVEIDGIGVALEGLVSLGRSRLGDLHEEHVAEAARRG